VIVKALETRPAGYDNAAVIFDGFVKSPALRRGIKNWSAPSAALPPCDARRQALHPCPVKCSLREAEKPTQGFRVLSCRSSKILYLTGWIIAAYR